MYWFRIKEAINKNDQSGSNRYCILIMMNNKIIIYFFFSLKQI
jgi:hypothetical protein